MTATTQTHTAIGELITYEVDCVSGSMCPIFTIGVPAKSRDEAERRAINRLQMQYKDRVFVVLESRKIR